MVRNRAEFCMLCGASPCRCNSTPAKKAPARKALSSAPLPPAPTPAKPTPQHTVKPVAKRAGLTAVPKSQQEVDVAELEERNALTLICKLMPVYAEDIQKVRNSLNMTPLEIDTLIWKRNRESQLNR